MTHPKTPSLFRFAAFAFFVSGFCGLLYQIIWMRLAFAAFGITTPVMSLVVSVFMAGLGLGSWLGGTLARRWKNSPASIPLFLYGLLETLIGSSAVLVPWSFSAGSVKLLTLGEADSFHYLLSSALVIFFSLLPWCVLMGATYPFMMAFLRRAAPEESSFSFLYKANLFGALTGTFLTAAVLVESLGFKGTLGLAMGLNVFIALGAFGSAFLLRSSQKSFKTPAFTTRQSFPVKTSSMASLAILFTTGFVSMAMEMVWTRDFSFILKTQVYSFASLLFTYLLSTYFGSWLYRRGLGNVSLSVPTLLGLAALFALLPTALDDPRLHQSIAGVLLSIVPFCAALGYLTPLLVDRLSAGDPEKAGKVYAFNIAGCLLGPLAASYLFLPFVGARLSLILLSLPLALFFLASPPKPRLVLSLLWASVLSLSLFWSTDYEEGFKYFYPRTVQHRDYAATTVAAGEGGNKELFVNGVGMSGLGLTTKIMAHLPLAFLPHPPHSALVVCFGMGTTFRSLLSWDIETTAVELVPGVFSSFDYFWPDADRLCALPNAHRVVDDGRRFLARSKENYDVITLDPPPPLEAAGSSLLYSAEFYEAANRRLKKDGILQQWIPNGDARTWQAAARALALSFPYIRVFPSNGHYGCHFIASLSPLPNLTARQMAGKMPPSAQRDFLEGYPSQTTEHFFTGLLNWEIPFSSLINPQRLAVLTDDRPFNEYFLLRRLPLWLNLSRSSHH